MTRRYLAFDIETAKVLPEHVTDLLAHRPLGICCAAAVADDRPGAKIWHGRNASGAPAPSVSRAEAQTIVEDLQDIVSAGYTLLTWNGLGFDFDVLSEESGLRAQCAELAVSHVDMMFHVVCALGYFLSLDKAARGMGLAGKAVGTAGFRAPVLWAQGRYKEAIEYNARDARIALDLALAAEQRGALQWQTRKGTRALLPLPAGWLPVARARVRPLPDTSWMADPPRREDFFRWINATG